MYEESNADRRAKLEEEMKLVCYRHFNLVKELEELEKSILRLEGSINENESSRRDIATEKSIREAAQEQPSE
jgi:hypothetical protein